MAASFGISAVFKSPSGKSGSSSSGSLSGNKSSHQSNPNGGQQNTLKVGSANGPSQQNVDKERLTVDISAMKQQYNKLRQRQKQAHIILTCNMNTIYFLLLDNFILYKSLLLLNVFILLISIAAMNNQMPIKEGVGANNGYRQQVGNNAASKNPSNAMNHLLLGKKPLVNSKPRRGPHPGAIPPEVRKSSLGTSSRTMVKKESSDLATPSKVSNSMPVTENDKSRNDIKPNDIEKTPMMSMTQNPSNMETSKPPKPMPVTHVACPQVRSKNLMQTFPK